MFAFNKFITRKEDALRLISLMVVV